MNLLDLLLSAAVLVAVVNGFRLGILARGASWIGLIAGLVLSIWTVPLGLSLLETGTPGLRLVVGIVALVLTVSVTAGIGDMVGMRLRSAVSRTGLGGVDRTLGALGGGVGVLAVIWLLIPAAAQVPGTVSTQVRESRVVGAIQGLAPEPPDAIMALRPLIDQTRFPDVFEDLRPAPDTGPPPSEIPVPAGEVAQAEAATVSVEAEGCGRLFEGSGWIASDGTVVTNAHVVAGADRVRVRGPDGGVAPATVVVFDDDRDLALLRVQGLDAQALATEEPRADAPGAAIGYPGGQDRPRTVPARVTDVRTAVGRDIYGDDRTNRRVVFLSAQLAQGDSGGPVIDRSGRVVGTTFAISPDRATTAFALAPSEVRSVLQAPRRPGETGRCISS